MAVRRKRAEHDNHDRWLISYADFITLLFAFFVVMYSLSSVNESKYKTFSDSLSIAFTNHPNSATTTLGINQQEQLLKALVDRRTARLGEQQRKLQEQMKALTNNLSQVMMPMIAQGQVAVTQVKRGVVINISASTLFKTGEANLQPASHEVLRNVATILAKENYPIEIEGHTDNIPIVTGQFPSNWELSSARASSVVRMLIDNGVPAKRLAAVGLADNQPVVANDTPDHRAKNRRVSITVLSPDIERIDAALTGAFNNSTAAKTP